MIKTLVCWLFGHRYVQKIVKGQHIEYDSWGTGRNAHSYVYEQTPFCIRCCKRNPHYEE